LKDISLDIEPGEKISIVGYNGSGKSTFMQLIAGLYSDFQGNISYNGIPFRSLNLESLRRNIGDTSLQENIFDGTIYENISLGNPDIKLEDVMWAAKQVGLEGFVQRLPRGFDTHLKPEGKNVPNSVRARILLARSVAPKPKLLAMESFLNNLEQSDRLSIVDFLTSPERPWTLIAVTDDPYLAAKSDRIIIMKDGQIIESGPFDRIQESPHFRRVLKVAYAQILQNGNGSGSHESTLSNT
jgi:ABC-type bacteriocin/lantibiotic exporter with double-glycine peptidase domain